MNIKLISKNGPNGTRFSFFSANIIKDIGKAKILAIKITTNPNNGLINNPKTNINLMSPQPKLSFLNIRFPNNIIPNINPNNIRPFPKLIRALLIP